ncbi:adenosylcobinamide-GDP ribazoletransferase [Paenibacillus athensensis]|uniref:Adenosylcobinamide-GDP ribazoletransferase n=1 Tax=Paenibacillus athensensis TaxID=1967502 RepID=A0A4Y8PS65_9BACL|nr:adenosylcobinamide-GDP ribazoletransferase [Paenibacillus athensensis]MCD1262010.1 adenosylcobinamide-GDP ribazoletransferase [Paenibacillus athensensis]
MRDRAVWALVQSGLMALTASFQFLTRLPIPVRLTYTDQVFRRSVVFYPLVGGVLGLLLALSGWGLQQWLPVWPATVLLLAFWVALTGGLHLDGLMDAADGLLSHRPREQMLEIMKDSRVGAMGVIVCVLHVLIKAALLSALPLSGGTGALAAGALLTVIPLWSRWFLIIAICRWPYARAGSGLGALFRSVRVRHALAGTVLALVLGCGALWLARASLETVVSLPAVAVLALLPGITALFGWALAAGIHRKLGGLTGDIYGALNELLEAVLLLVVVALLV